MTLTLVWSSTLLRYNYCLKPIRVNDGSTYDVDPCVVVNPTEVTIVWNLRVNDGFTYDVDPCVVVNPTEVTIVWNLYELMMDLPMTLTLVWSSTLLRYNYCLKPIRVNDGSTYDVDPCVVVNPTEVTIVWNLRVNDGFTYDVDPCVVVNPTEVTIVWNLRVNDGSTYDIVPCVVVNSTEVTGTAATTRGAVSKYSQPIFNHRGRDQLLKVSEFLRDN